MAPPSPPILRSVPKARPGSIQFWWDPPLTGPVTGYRIQCFNPVIDRTVSASDYTAIFTGLTDGTTYEFQIEAFNNDGYSDPAFFMVAQPGVVSGPPTSVSADYTNPTGATVAWTAPTTPLDIEAYWVTGIPSDSTNSNDYIIRSQNSNQSSILMPVNYNNRSYSFNVRALTSPGWSIQSISTSSVASLDTLYGCYVTNVIGSFRPITDTQGNQWMYAKPIALSTAIQMFNRFGQLIQTIAAGNVNSNTTVVIHIGTDGLNNCWMARIQGLSISSTVTTNGALREISNVDSFGNLYMVQDNTLSSSTVVLYDKNNTLVQTQSITNVTPISVVVKISSTGVWSGSSSDTNTWIAYFQSATFTSQTLRSTSVNLDENNNIIVSYQCNGSTGITYRSYDKLGNVIGSTSTYSGLNPAVIVKYGSSGLAADSWHSAILATSAIVPNSDSVKINRYGQIIAAVAYRSTATIVGSDNVQVGEVLPFISTMGVASSFTETCVVRFCGSGQGALSWRAVQYTSTLGLSKNELPRSLHITSTDDIIHTMYSENLSTNMQFFACGSTNSSFLSTTVNMNNVLMMKYTNAGSLEWLTGLIGNAASLNASTCTYFYTGAALNTFSTTPTTRIFTTLDQQDNLVIYGAYYRAGFNFINALGQVIGRTANPNATFANNTFIAKLNTNNGLSGYLAMQGQIVSFPNNTSGLQPFRVIIDQSNHIVAVGQHYSTNTAYYVNSNMSTSYIRPQSYTGTNEFNSAVMRYDPFLSTVSTALLQTSVRNGLITPQYFAIDSQNNIIVSGQYRSTMSLCSWFTSTNTISAVISGVSTQGTYGMFTTKITGSATNSWVTQVGDNNGSTITASHFQVATGADPLAGYLQINPSTNRIYCSGVSSNFVPTLYDKNNTPVIQLGQPTAVRGSNVAYFVALPANGTYY